MNNEGFNIFKSIQQISSSEAAIPDYIANIKRLDDEDDDLNNFLNINNGHIDKKEELKNFDFDLELNFVNSPKKIFDFNFEQEQAQPSQPNQNQQNQTNQPNQQNQQNQGTQIVNYFFSNTNSNTPQLQSNLSLKELDESKKNKEKKLMRNRMSAKKSREKKKNYISYLETQIEKLQKNKKKPNLKNIQKLLSQKRRRTSPNNKTKTQKEEDILFLDSNFKSLMDIEKKMLNKKQNKIDSNENTYLTLQKQCLTKFLIYQIKIIMPIKLKLFQNKFFKVETFELTDTLETLKEKVDTNLKLVNTVFQFNDKNMNDSQRGKIEIDSLGFQFYQFYSNLKQYLSLYDNLTKLVD